ncbi:hypothetical protein [Treponema sp.]|uniref:hypothetical protein n=1 Tax=Treponema sp. TaxID=166 RepID=UPI00388D6943
MNLILLVFASVSRYGGKISTFSLENNGQANFLIHGCTCEDIVNARYCVVSFENSEPHFNIFLPENDFMNERKVCDSENPGRTINFSFEINLSVLHTLLRLFASTAKSLGWNEKSLSIIVKKNKCRIDFSFYKEHSDSKQNRLLPVLARYAFLFSDEKGNLLSGKYTKFSKIPIAVENPVINGRKISC